MVPPFVQKLYELVNASSTDELIRWADTGDSFFVFEHERFANDVLPRFFKHRNFSSFVRQLNMYGFHKIPHLQQGVLKSDTETEFWNFEHPNFNRGQPDLLCLVTRKNSKGGSQQNAELVDGDVPVPNQGSQILDVNSIVSGITAIKRHQQAISADLNELKASNQHLWQEALTCPREIQEPARYYQPTVDNHRASTPLVRRNQRFLIGNGTENAKHKGVEVVEVEDDDNKSIAGRTALGSPTPSASPGPYFPEQNSGSLLTPTSTWANTSGLDLPAPAPLSASATNNSALELHRTASPTQDQIMQAAFQQLMQSPGQVQRLMQLLSSGSTNGSTPPLTAPTPSGTWTPPMSVDLSQLALYDGGGGSVGALTFDDKDTIGPSQSQLTEEEARLAHTYHNANEIDADVSALQANINELIENMGFDSAPVTAAPHSHPPLSSVGGREAPAGADFDFDAFLTAFASEQDGVSVPLPLPTLGSVSGADTNAAEAGIPKVPAEDRPVAAVAGRKRPSDVAELALPLPALSASATPSPSAATEFGATSTDLPRVKRNKK
ncbi:transcription factor Hsf1 [Lactarius deliciosus]|nr:transcription factor Hsf1 [Lactarius deliciosus]